LPLIWQACFFPCTRPPISNPIRSFSYRVPPYSTTIIPGSFSIRAKWWASETLFRVGAFQALSRCVSTCHTSLGRPALSFTVFPLCGTQTVRGVPVPPPSSFSGCGAGAPNWAFRVSFMGCNVSLGLLFSMQRSPPLALFFCFFSFPRLFPHLSFFLRICVDFLFFPPQMSTLKTSPLLPALPFFRSFYFSKESLSIFFSSGIRACCSVPFWSDVPFIPPTLHPFPCAPLLFFFFSFPPLPTKFLRCASLFFSAHQVPPQARSSVP